MPKNTLTEKDVTRFWDRNAEQWHRQIRSGFDISRETFNQPAFLDFVGAVSGMRLLDAGCGDGFVTRQLAERGAGVTGIDLSPEMIRWARAEEQAAPLGIHYEVGTYNDLSFLEAASFDRVISFMALMDGPSLELAFSQFFTVLRPGGELAFSIPHPCFFTPGLKWQRENQQTRLLVGQYFEREAQVREWLFPGSPKGTAPFQVPHYWRALSDYINTLCTSGFSVVAINEPRPDENACKKYPFLRPWRRHAALYLHVRARKPAA